jgi:hypothetical protein
MSDRVSGKSRSVVGHTDHQSPAIFRDIVNAVRNGDAYGIGAEVVITDLTRNRFPTTARVFEITDEFAFFGVHADDGPMTAPKTVTQLRQIFELKITLGTVVGGDLFLIDPQGVTHGMEQASHGIGGNGNVELGKLFCDRGGGAARPA